MPSLKQTLLATASLTASLASAQTPPPTTTQLYLVGVDAHSPFEASIVAASGPTTTYAVHCAPGTDSSDCGINDARVTVAPDAYDIRDSSGSMQFSQHCSVSAGTPTACTGVGQGDVGSAVPVTIVGGAVSSSSSSSPSVTSPASAGSTGSGTVASSSSSSSSSATATAAAPMGSASASAGAGATGGAVRARGSGAAAAAAVAAAALAGVALVVGAAL